MIPRHFSYHRSSFWLVLLLLAAAQASAAERAAGRRWAVLIGVDQYKRLVKLDYCGDDVRALGDRLLRSGFERERVVVLHKEAKGLDFQPIKLNIEEQIKLVLGSAKEGDLVLLSFSGHGVRIGGRSYLCPYEADLEDTSTLVSLDAIFKRLEDCPAAVKLFVVDACQNDVVQKGERTAAGARAADEFGKSLGEVAPPKGTLLLTSCAPGEKSREADEFKHGVFMHYMLEGLGGQADNNRNGTVTLFEMFAYASDRTQDYVRLNHKALQRPSLRGAIVDFPLVEVGLSQEVTNSIGMKLRLIPAGEFLMGSPESEKDRGSDEGPQHRVRITSPFYMGMYEVTLGQFRQFVSDRGYKTEAETDGKGGYGFDGKEVSQKPEYTWRNAGFSQTDDHPAVNVSWNDAVAFCQWVSRKEGKTYRLPTEAEWEYACRAGTRTAYYYGDDPEGLALVGNVVDGTAKEKFPDWTSAIAAKDGYVFTAPAGQYRPNGFGLYDMHGNVYEWCADWYDKEYYANSPTDDPPGPTSGSFRVPRGGGWYGLARRCRSACRITRVPEYRSYDLGFRVSQVAE